MHKQSISIVLLLAFAVSAMPTVSAATCSEVGPEGNTLFAHSDNSNVWMSTCEVDPAATEASDGFNGSVYALSNTLGAPLFEFPMTPPLSMPVAMDGAGTVDFFIYPGASAADVGAVVITTELLANGAAIASGDSGPVVLDGGVQEVLISATPSATDIPSGAELMWNIYVEGFSGQIVLSLTGDEHTRIELPLPEGDVETGGGGLDFEPVVEDFEADNFDRSDAFEDAAQVGYVYNWTAPAMDPIAYTVDLNVTAGFLYVSIYDPNGEPVVDTVAGESEISSGVTDEGVDAGVWSVIVYGENVTGGFQINIDQAEPMVEEPADGGDEQPDEPTSEEGSANAEPDGGETQDDEPVVAAEASKDAPGASLLAVLGVLIAGIVVARRRHA